VADLIEELRTLSDHTTPLDARLERVRVSAEAIWDLPRLPWFTDHRAQRHSARLIALLGQATDALQQSSRRLTRAEIYVLLAACYLHDIGMQDITVGAKGWEELDVGDYEHIRKRHPSRGKELIVQGALSQQRGGLRVDLDDLPEYLQPIALVSQGHGSGFYDATVAELDGKTWAPDGQAIRGSLLAALLLMADELDIGSERASFPQGGHLSAISALHHFLNHYVVLTSVDPGVTSKRRQVGVVFEFPPDSDDYRPDIRRVLIDKLSSQARRTNPTVERATDGELVWETRVVVTEQTDTLNVRRQIEPRALSQLRRELRSADLVSRDEIVQCVRTAIGTPGGVTVISLTAPGDSDLDAIGRWLAAEMAAEHGHFMEMSFRPQVGRDRVSVIAEIANWAGGSPSDDGVLAEARAGEVGQALADNSETLHGFLFRALEAADPEAAEAIREIVNTFRAGGGHGIVVLSHDGSASVEADHHFILDPIGREELARYLVREFGYTGNEAAHIADEFLTVSGGRAGPIVSLLAARRLASQVDG
jgi:hypothetical protein